MKLFMLPIALVLCSLCHGQIHIIDSLLLKLKSERSDTTKIILLYNLSYYYQKFKPDTALQLAQEAYVISKNRKFTRGISNSLAQMAGSLNRVGNYPKALEYYIEQLKIEEKQESVIGIAYVHMDIAHVYNNAKDTKKALYYALRADSIAREHGLADVLVYTSLNVGDIYSDANELDSAKKYTLMCYQESVKQHKDIITGTALNNLGNIYFRSGDLKSALQNFQSSVPYLEHMQDFNTLAECKLGIAKVYQKLGLPDSALYFAKQSFQLASEGDFLKHALNSSALVSQLYKQIGTLDSAFAFQETQLVLKDSFDNREKIKEVQNITISEQIRQKELAETRAREKKQRRTMLQLLAIGIFIPVCFFISAFVSRKNVNEKVISFLGVFSVLLLFEYITLFVHPFVAKTTNYSPVLEIIIFVTIAAVLTPSHHKIEKWLVSRLTSIHSSHRQRRLAALKKRQEKAEGEGSDSITLEAPVDPL